MLKNEITPMQLVVSTVKAAEMLDRDPQAIRSYIKSGKLQGVKLGKDWKVTVKSIYALVEPEAK